jgi:leucyl-tRNA synthetase
MRFKVSLSVELSSKEIEDYILGLPETQKYLEGKTPKKTVIVPGRIVNFVS